MNYLKRRFSSGDLQSEHDESVMTMPTSTEPHSNMSTQSSVTRQSGWEGKSSTYTSAPSSPTRNLSFADQFISVARGVVNQAIQQIPHQQAGTSGLPTSHQPSHYYSNQIRDHQEIFKEKCKLLLVIDDQHTDW